MVVLDNYLCDRIKPKSLKQKAQSFDIMLHLPISNIDYDFALISTKKLMNKQSICRNIYLETNNPITIYFLNVQIILYANCTFLSTPRGVECF